MEMHSLGKVWRSVFDHVYCVSFAPYLQRRERLVEELKRVEIIDKSLDSDTDSFFSFHLTVDNPFEQLLLTHPEFSWPKNNMRFNKGALSLALGHYSVMKEAKVLNYKRILVIEDDIVFLKDKDKLKNILEYFPTDGDIVMLDKVTPTPQAWALDIANNRDSSGMYVTLSPNDILWTTSCFALTTKAMSHICYCQEKSFNVADYYTNAFVPNKEHKIQIANFQVKRMSSIVSLACQRPSEETISDHGEENSVYKQRGLYDCGINFSEYNL